MRRQLEHFVLAEGIPDVRFSGFLNQTEISRAYAASDMLVLPSKEGETWGLVVNEAMNFSLPVIVSDKVGCAGDLVVPSENGYIFPTGHAEALADHIGRLVNDGTRRETFGCRSLRMIEDWDISRTASGVIDALGFSQPDGLVGLTADGH
jgi:glycosyltransferase involved in cell wall biosynthesis